jgi:hypothetical protein
MYTIFQTLVYLEDVILFKDPGIQVLKRVFGISNNPPPTRVFLYYVSVSLRDFLWVARLLFARHLTFPFLDVNKFTEKHGTLCAHERR